MYIIYKLQSLQITINIDYLNLHIFRISTVLREKQALMGIFWLKPMALFTQPIVWSVAKNMAMIGSEVSVTL